MLCACAPQAQNNSASNTINQQLASTQTQANDFGNQIVARVDGQDITIQQLTDPLLRVHGLSLLLQIAQLDVVRTQAEKSGITISDADIEKETQLTLDVLPGFEGVTDPAERQHMLSQFLKQQQVSSHQFSLVMQANAYLRKLAEPLVVGRITDETVQEAFNQQYGETVQVGYIQLANLGEVAEAKRRLAAGKSFAEVAREMSRNPRTGPLGGELPPFTRNNTGYPEAFRQAAFALKVDEVSDPVEAEGAFHLIKLEHRFAPKAVKLEDVRDSVKKNLTERLIQATMSQLRQQFTQHTLATLEIINPILKQEYDKRLNEQQADLQDRDEIRKELERREREAQPVSQPSTTTQPSASQPATIPTTPITPATQPSPATIAPTAPTHPAANAPAPDKPTTQPTTAAAAAHAHPQAPAAQAAH